MEKCIFLDRFMQHPKDFRKIASFLRNKTVKDCVAFYYDSKQSVPYKTALKEHIMRRKRRGDYHMWDSTIQAALSCGATVTAGTSESKPLVFTLPASDKTYFTRNFHPLNHELLDSVNISASSVVPDMGSPQKEGRSRKRSSAPLFTLDPEQRKFLRATPQDVSDAKQKAEDEGISEGLDRSMSSSSFRNSECAERDSMTPGRKPPQKWSASEKKLFADTVDQYGRFFELSSDQCILVLKILVTNRRQELVNARLHNRYQVDFSDQELLL